MFALDGYLCYNIPMNKRANYYVSGKNPLIWIAALLLVCSAGFRIAYFCEKGADTTTVWFQIILPVAATLIYAAIILLDGKEHFYRTAAPVFMNGKMNICATLTCYTAGVWYNGRGDE